MWVLLVSPFITAIMAFLIINATSVITDAGSQEIQVLINGIMFSMWMLIGFAICSGLFIVGLVYDRE